MKQVISKDRLVMRMDGFCLMCVVISGLNGSVQYDPCGMPDLTHSSTSLRNTFQVKPLLKNTVMLITSCLS